MKKISIVFAFLCLVIMSSSALAISGLTIDVTGPGGIGVKEIQPGLVTGEIWATVTGLDPDTSNESLSSITGGLRLTGGG